MENRKMSIHLLILAGLLVTSSLRSMEEEYDGAGEQGGQGQYYAPSSSDYQGQDEQDVKPPTPAEIVQNGNWQDALMLYDKYTKDPKGGQMLKRLRQGLMGTGFAKKWKRVGRQTFDPVAVEQAIKEHCVGMTVAEFVQVAGTLQEAEAGVTRAVNGQAGDGWTLAKELGFVKNVLKVLDMVDSIYAKEYVDDVIQPLERYLVVPVENKAALLEESFAVVDEAARHEPPHDEATHDDRGGADLANIDEEVDLLEADLAVPADQQADAHDKALEILKTGNWAGALTEYAAILKAVVNKVAGATDLRDKAISALKGEGDERYRRVVGQAFNRTTFDVVEVVRQMKLADLITPPSANDIEAIERFIAIYEDKENFENALKKALETVKDQKSLDELENRVKLGVQVVVKISFFDEEKLSNFLASPEYKGMIAAKEKTFAPAAPAQAKAVRVPKIKDDTVTAEMLNALTKGDGLAALNVYNDVLDKNRNWETNFSSWLVPDIRNGLNGESEGSIYQRTNKPFNIEDVERAIKVIIGQKGSVWKEREILGYFIHRFTPTVIDKYVLEVHGAKEVAFLEGDATKKITGLVKDLEGMKQVYKMIHEDGIGEAVGKKILDLQKFVEEKIKLKTNVATAISAPVLHAAQVGAFTPPDQQVSVVHLTENTLGLAQKYIKTGTWEQALQTYQYIVSPLFTKKDSNYNKMVEGYLGSEGFYKRTENPFSVERVAGNIERLLKKLYPNERPQLQKFIDMFGSNNFEKTVNTWFDHAQGFANRAIAKELLLEGVEIVAQMNPDDAQKMRFVVEKKFTTPAAAASDPADDEDGGHHGFANTDDDAEVVHNPAAAAPAVVVDTLAERLSKEGDVLAVALRDVVQMVVHKKWPKALEAYDAVVSSKLSKKLHDEIIAGFNGAGTTYKRVEDDENEVYPFNVKAVVKKIQAMYKGQSSADPITDFITYYTDSTLERTVKDAIWATTSPEGAAKSLNDAKIVAGMNIIKPMDAQFSKALDAMNKRLQAQVKARVAALKLNLPADKVTIFTEGTWQDALKNYVWLQNGSKGYKLYKGLAPEVRDGLMGKGRYKRVATKGLIDVAKIEAIIKLNGLDDVKDLVDFISTFGSVSELKEKVADLGADTSVLNNNHYLAALLQIGLAIDVITPCDAAYATRPVSAKDATTIQSIKEGLQKAVLKLFKYERIEQYATAQLSAQFAQDVMKHFPAPVAPVVTPVVVAQAQIAQIAFTPNNKLNLPKELGDTFKTGNWKDVLWEYNDIQAAHNGWTAFPGTKKYFKYQDLLPEIRASVAGQDGKYKRTVEPKFDVEAVKAQVLAMGNGMTVGDFINTYGKFAQCKNEVNWAISNQDDLRRDAREQKDLLNKKLAELQKAITIIQPLDQACATELTKIQGTLETAIAQL